MRQIILTIDNNDMTNKNLEKRMEREFEVQKNKNDLCELPLVEIKKKFIKTIKKFEKVVKN